VTGGLPQLPDLVEYGAEDAVLHKGLENLRGGWDHNQDPSQSTQYSFSDHGGGGDCE
jgi:hypothetical protein